MSRIDIKQVEQMQEENKTETAAVAEPSADKKPSANKKPEQASSDIIEFADFAKVDLRVAEIVEANHVEGADKLLQLSLKLGNKTVNVFSGIKAHYQPEELVGRKTVVVANLAPRKMKFGVSEGMVLCAGEDDKIWLLEAHSDAEPGSPVT